MMLWVEFHTNSAVETVLLQSWSLWLLMITHPLFQILPKKPRGIPERWFCSSRCYVFSSGNVSSLIQSHFSVFFKVTWMRDETPFPLKTQHPDGVPYTLDWACIKTIWQILGTCFVLVLHKMFSFCHLCDRFALIRTAMPSTPVLGKPECYSRKCIMKVEQSVRTQHLEVQYRAEKQTWTTYQDSVRHFNSSEFENLGTFSEKSRSQRYHRMLPKPLKIYS